MTFEEKIKEFEQKQQALLNEYGLTATATYDLPRYRELPPEVALSLVVLKNHGIVFKVLLEEIKEEK